MLKSFRLNEIEAHLASRVGGFILAALTLILCLAYVVRLAMSQDVAGDFWHFWAAGKLWAMGENPYSADFNVRVRAEFGFEAINGWFYSPHTWLMSRPLAGLGFDTALLVWRVLSVTALAVGTALVVSLRSEEGRGWKRLLWAVLLLWAVTSQPGSINFTIGQFSAFLFLAVVLFFYGVLRQKNWAVVVALVLLSMKLSLALPFIGYAAAVPRLRVPMLLAGGIALAASMPAFLAGGTVATVAGYFEGIGQYTKFDVNGPLEVIGLRNLLAHWFGISVSGIVLAIGAGLLGMILGWFSWRNPERMSPTFSLVLLLAWTMLLIPQHRYDLLILPAFFIHVGQGWLWANLAVMALVFRAHIATALTGLPDMAVHAPGSYLCSLAMLGLCAVLHLRLLKAGSVKDGSFLGTA
jgi:hypothetical protein